VVVVDDSEQAAPTALTSRPGEEARLAATTYGSAADHYTAPALGFWDRFGAETIHRLALSSGVAVLDLCCGAGGSALSAARAVGDAGRVLGLDVAEPLLRIARERAFNEGLRHVEFRCADASDTGLPDASFDAVVCVFGVFFAADVRAFVREMSRVTRPGGTVAITTWGPGLFEPANGLFWDAVGAQRPELYKAYNPWDSLTTSAAVADLLVAADLTDVGVEYAHGSQALQSPGAFWDVVLGSGYRATVDALSPAECRAVEERLLEELTVKAIDNIQTDVLFATGRRRPIP
jgi:SAM-dependent methyltransferase